MCYVRHLQARTTIDNWIFAVSNPIYFVLNTKSCSLARSFVPSFAERPLAQFIVAVVAIVVCYKVSCFRVRFNVI